MANYRDFYLDSTIRTSNKNQLEKRMLELRGFYKGLLEDPSTPMPVKFEAYCKVELLEQILTECNWRLQNTLPSRSTSPD